MKKINNINFLTKNILKIFIFLMGFCFFSGIVDAATIESKTEGGNWSNTGTWIGGEIPGENDDVIINGLVKVTGIVNSRNLTINQNGIIKKEDGVYYGQVNINGKLLNNGIVGGQQNYNATKFTIYGKGIIENNGSISYTYIYSYDNIINNDTGIWSGSIYLWETNINSIRNIKNNGDFNPHLILGGDLTLTGDINYNFQFALQNYNLYLDGSKNIYLGNVYSGKIKSINGENNSESITLGNAKGIKSDFQNLVITENSENIEGNDLNIKGTLKGSFKANNLFIDNSILIGGNTTINGKLIIGINGILNKDTTTNTYSFTVNGEVENNGNIYGKSYYLEYYFKNKVINNGIIQSNSNIYIYDNIENGENSIWTGIIIISGLDSKPTRDFDIFSGFTPNINLNGNLTIQGPIDFKGGFTLQNNNLYIDGKQNIYINYIYGNGKVLSLNGNGDGEKIKFSKINSSFETNIENIEILNSLKGIVGRNITLLGNISGISKFDNLTINGIVSINSETNLTGNLIIGENGNLKKETSTTNSYNLHVNGDIYNNGIIGDNNNYRGKMFSLYSYGNIINNNIINNNNLSIYGSIDNINGLISSTIIYIRWNNIDGYKDYIFNITGIDDIIIPADTKYKITNTFLNTQRDIYWKVKGEGLIFDSDWTETKCINVNGCVNIKIPGESQIPTPTNLNQYIIPATLEEKEEIQIGSKIGKFQSGSGVIFELELDNPESKELRLNIELYKKGETKTKQNYTSDYFTNSGKVFTKILLSEGDYYWNIKIEDRDGNASEIVDFKDNGTDTDFSIFEGFEPYPYGYSFVNTSPISGLLTGGIKNVPNEKSYINLSIEPGPKQEVFDALFPITYFENENKRIAAFISYGFNEKDPYLFYIGNCHGLSLISTTYKKYPLKINEVSNEFYNTIGSGTIYDNISLLTDDNGKWKDYNEILKTILFFQYQQKHTNYTTKANYYVKNKNPIDILNELKANPDKLYILSFGGAKTEKYKVKGHAVIPYRVEGNRIYIWDNNVPYPNYSYKNVNYNAYEQYIEVYGNGKNDFKIKLYTDEAFGFNYFSDMSIVDLETIYGETENKAMGLNGNDTLYTLSGNNEIVLKDELGRITGYKDGQIYEEIPGSIFVRNYGVTLDSIDKENTWKQIYLPKKLENLTIEINGKTEEKYDLIIAGGDYFTKLEGINTAIGQTDVFNISRENIKIDLDDNKILSNSYNLLSYDFQNNSTGSIYLHQLEIIKEKQNLDIDWNKVINNTDNSISYSIDLDNDGIYDTESNFNSLPKTENETGNISGYLKGINSPGNSNMAGWKIYIDSNNDGELQENKEKIVVTDNNGYYEFKDLEKGDYNIRIIMKPNWEQIKPNNNYYDISLNNGQNIVNLNFENKFLKGNNKK